MTEIKVIGMTCGGCVASVKKAVARVYPSAAVDVSLETGLVQIQGDIDQLRVEDAIKTAGFEVASRPH